MKSRSLTWVGRVSVAMAALLSHAVAATPAVAAPPQPYLKVDISGGGVAPGSAGMPLPVHYTALAISHPKIDFYLRNVLDFATLTFPDSCLTDGEHVQCPLKSGVRAETFFIQMRPAAGRASGEGTVWYFTSFDGSGESQHQFNVGIRDRADVVVASPHTGQVGKARPGDRISIPMAFTNVGNRPADEFNVVLTVYYGLVPVVPSGCTSEHYITQIYVRCSFTDSAHRIAPGATLTLPDLTMTVAGDAYGRQGVTVSSDNGVGWSDYTWDIANSYDLQPIGDTATGKVGDRVEIWIGLRNNGPASLDGARTGTSRRFTFVLPPGTKLITPTENCGAFVDSPGTTTLQCGTLLHLHAGTEDKFYLNLRITELVPNATGTVLAQDPLPEPGTPQTDTNPDNDRATVVINPTAAGTGGSGGAGLPITGTRSVVVGGVGGALVAVGIVLYLLTRRRRLVLTIPESAMPGPGN